MQWGVLNISLYLLKVVVIVHNREVVWKQARPISLSNYWFLYVTDYMGERWMIQHGLH